MTTLQVPPELENLLVCVPCAELGYSDFWQHLTTIPDWGLLIALGRVVTHANSSLIHGAHNAMIWDILRDEGLPPAKRLLWLEYDHLFPADVFRKHGAYSGAIVGGVYPQRRLWEPLPVLFNWDEGRYNAERPSEAEFDRMFAKRGLYEIDIVPMGCTSIRWDVLANWPREVAMYGSPTNPTNFKVLTDDVWFCRMAQDQGYDIWVDTSLQVSHRITHYINDEFYLKWRKSRA